MLKTLRARLHQKHRTMAYPAQAPVLPELFRGYPVLKPETVSYTHLTLPTNREV